MSGLNLKRFSHDDRCPVCGGYAAQPPPGRCTGYYDATGRYARCSRSEHAGSLPQNTDGTYTHLRQGDCRCGVVHGGPGAATQPSPNGHVAEPPRDLEAEASVLGAILLDQGAVTRVLDFLSPEDFYRENNGQIYRAALALARGSEPIDHTTLSAQLEKMGVLERVGGRSHLAELEAVVPTAANIEHYARIVKDKSERRRGIKAREDEIKRLYDPAMPLPHMGAEPVGVLLSAVTPTKVRWLRPGRIPLGKMIVLDGDPGLGKSMLTLDLAARVTNGRLMPDYASGVRGGVVILTAEDGLDDTVRPRLDAAGALVDRIVALPVVGTGEAEHDPVLPDDLDAVTAAIKRVSAVLVIVDPLMAYLSSETNAHRDQDARRALRRCARMAEQTGVAVLVVRHLNKAGGVNALYRGGGSIGIIGAARSGMLVAKDPEDENKRVLAMTKANLAAPVPSLGYRVVPPVAEDGAPTIEWLGEVSHNAMALLALGPEADEKSKTLVEDTMDFLRDLLGHEELPAKEAKARAREKVGASDRTVMEAKARLGVRSRKLGVGGGWVWYLPDEKPPLPDQESGEECSPSLEPASFEEGTQEPKDVMPAGSTSLGTPLHPSGPVGVDHPYPNGQLCQRCKAVGWHWSMAEGTWVCDGCGKPVGTPKASR